MNSERDRDHISPEKIPQTAVNQNDDFTARSALHAAGSPVQAPPSRAMNLICRVLCK